MVSTSRKDLGSGRRGAPRSFYSYLILGAAPICVHQTFSLLAPILFSFLLIVLISLAVNPVISRMRAFTGGRKGATGLMVAALFVFIALTGWAFFGPMSEAGTKLWERLPTYWERLQKPLIRMEQEAVLSEKKLQAEVTTEMARPRRREASPKPRNEPLKPAPPQPRKRQNLFVPG